MNHQQQEDHTNENHQCVCVKAFCGSRNVGRITRHTQSHTHAVSRLLEAAGDPLLSLAALPREEELRLVGRFFTGSLDAAAAAEGRAAPDPWLTDGFGLEVTTVGPGNPEGLSVTRGLGIPGKCRKGPKGFISFRYWEKYSRLSVYESMSIISICQYTENSNIRYQYHINSKDQGQYL